MPKSNFYHNNKFHYDYSKQETPYYKQTASPMLFIFILQPYQIFILLIVSDMTKYKWNNNKNNTS